MVGVPFATAEEIREIDETLWFGLNYHSHYILKLRHVAPDDRNLILQTGKRGRPWADIHADDVFASCRQTLDDAWTNKSRTADDQDGHVALPLAKIAPEWPDETTTDQSILLPHRKTSSS